jgi:hypothetical protein
MYYLNYAMSPWFDDMKNIIIFEATLAHLSQRNSRTRPNVNAIPGRLLVLKVTAIISNWSSAKECVRPSVHLSRKTRKRIKNTFKSDEKLFN